MLFCLLSPPLIHPCHLWNRLESENRRWTRTPLKFNHNRMSSMGDKCVDSGVITSSIYFWSSIFIPTKSHPGCELFPFEFESHFWSSHPPETHSEWIIFHLAPTTTVVNVSMAPPLLSALMFCTRTLIKSSLFFPTTWHVLVRISQGQNRDEWRRICRILTKVSRIDHKFWSEGEHSVPYFGNHQHLPRANQKPFPLNQKKEERQQPKSSDWSNFMLYI